MRYSYLHDDYASSSKGVHCFGGLNRSIDEIWANVEKHGEGDNETNRSDAHWR